MQKNRSTRLIRWFLCRGGGLVALWGLVLWGCEPTRVCSYDTECQRKGEVCREGKCTQQGFCEEDSNCIYKGEICNVGVCVLENPPTPPPATCPTGCSGNSDCVNCKDGRLECYNNRCVKSERAGKYSRCDDALGKACVEGTICAGATETRYCMPTCDPKASNQCDTTSDCRDPNNAGVGLCYPKGLADENGACSPNYVGDPQLDASKICKDGLFCDGSNCKKPTVVGKFKKCGRETICETTARCIGLSPVQPHGYCLPQCDTKTPDCEGGIGTCVQTSGGQGVCLLKGNAPEDKTCGPTGDEIKPEQFCASGLGCLQIPPSASMCLKKVAKCAEGSCAADRICLSGDNGGFCALACQNGTCPNGMKCTNLTLNTGGSAQICTP